MRSSRWTTPTTTQQKLSFDHFSKVRNRFVPVKVRIHYGLGADQCSSTAGASVSINWSSTELPRALQNLLRPFVCTSETKKVMSALPSDTVVLFQTLFVYGGRLDEDATDQFWAYRMEEHQWSPILTKSLPGVRRSVYFHRLDLRCQRTCCSSSRNSLMVCHETSGGAYLYGGANEHQELTSDCYRLDFAAGWQRVDVPRPTGYSELTISFHNHVQPGKLRVPSCQRTRPPAAVLLWLKTARHQCPSNH